MHTREYMLDYIINLLKDVRDFSLTCRTSMSNGARRSQKLE